MTSRFIAMVPLERVAAAVPSDVTAAFDRLFPQLAGTLVRHDDSDVRETFGGGLYLLDGAALPVMVIDQPIPQGTMDHAIGATRIWPDARAMNDHRAHVIVSSFEGTETFEDAFKAARSVTLLSAAILEATPSIGVYWTTGETVTRPDMFIECAQQLVRDGAPLDAHWIQYYWLGGPPQDGRPTLAVVTQGLLPFIGRELEFEPVPLTPLELGTRIVGTVIYLLTNGPVIGDGDTVGVSYAESIRARYRDRGQRPDVPVISLTLEYLDADHQPAA